MGQRGALIPVGHWWENSPSTELWNYSDQLLEFAWD